MIALCLGGALSVWDEVHAARRLLGDRPHLVIACNFAGVTFPGHLDGWVTLHPDRLPQWRTQRARLGLNTNYRAFAHEPASDAETVPMALHGSSGLYAAQVAFEAFQASGVILCGVPMDGTGSHIHWGGEWGHRHHYEAAFLTAKEQGWNVRSMLGWTAKTFGKPDLNWIEQHG